MIASLEETRDFRRLAEVLFIRGWAEASAGNMSLRLADVPVQAGGPAPDPRRVQKTDVDMTDLIGDRFLVTASGSRMREIAAEPEKGLCLIQVLDHQQFWLIDGPAQLSSEWPTHAGLHSLFKESRSGERAVVHCHPLNLIALSHVFNSEKEMNDRIFRMQHETRLFVPEMLGLIPYEVTGSKGPGQGQQGKAEEIPPGPVGQARGHRQRQKPGPGPGPDRGRGESGRHLPAAAQRGAGARGLER